MNNGNSWHDYYESAWAEYCKNAHLDHLARQVQLAYIRVEDELKVNSLLIEVFGVNAKEVPERSK